MGRISDFFKRIRNGKNKNVNMAQSSIPNYEDRHDLNLYYKSGASAHVKFEDELTSLMLNDGTYKELQKAIIQYIKPDGSFESKDVFLEPINLTYDNGVTVNTKDYYKALTKSDLSLIKGFFEENQVRSLDTNYIGYIGQNNDGTYNRSYDNSFKQIYKSMSKQKFEENKERYKEEQKQKDKTFREELMERTEKYGVNYKTCHAQYLGKEPESKEIDEGSYER